jgi:hypothetical protein
MKNGGFLNQKLGKHLTRKTDLLKSELAVQRKVKSRPIPLNLSWQEKSSSPRKPTSVPPIMPFALSPSDRAG